MKRRSNSKIDSKKKSGERKKKRIIQKRKKNIIAKPSFNLSGLGSSDVRIPRYNPLFDRHLREYYRRPVVRKVLQNNCFVDNSGRILDQSGSNQSVRIIDKEFSKLENHRRWIIRDRKYNLKKERALRLQRKDMKRKKMLCAIKRREYIERLVRRSEKFPETSSGSFFRKVRKVESSGKRKTLRPNSAAPGISYEIDVPAPRQEITRRPVSAPRRMRNI